MRESPYQTIKRSIADGIAAGQWSVGALLPSEHALCAAFRVSRMTVNRAMRELAAEHRVRRVPGVGTFVAEPVVPPLALPLLAESGLVEIRNIAAEIRARGHRYRAKVLVLEAMPPPAEIANGLALRPGATVFLSVILHLEDERPLQLEERFVRPEAAPAYLGQDFTLTTPNEYLSRVAPLSEAEQYVQAVAATPQVAGLMGLGAGEPCLQVVRRTWCGGQPVSIAELTHPGSRFRLSGRFRTAMGETSDG